MIEQTTIDKLIEMRLTAMANALIIQAEDHKVKDLTFSERLGMLVDIEYSSRKSNRLKRLIKAAEFDQPEACVMDINYRSERKPNKDLIQKLTVCEYITEFQNTQGIPHPLS
jgi:DNA replication protein DnaC